jgi:crossover junction endodeoxyribonuclease RuvC
LNNIILGVDPGSRICGYGVISKNGNLIELLEYGVVKVNLRDASFNDRLLEIHDRLQQVIARNKPTNAAFENLFFAKNVQSLVKLSHARAVAILAAVQNHLEISEYSPREIKKSVTGNGNASKEQVQFMVKTLLNIKENHQFFDATDALSVAICHSMRSANLTNTHKSWKDFIQNNPDRIIK